MIVPRLFLRFTCPRRLLQVIPEDLYLFFGEFDLSTIVIGDEDNVILNYYFGTAFAFTTKIELFHYATSSWMKYTARLCQNRVKVNKICF